jgi:DNA invertase Pin-like site-specific DNA recombinase
MTPRKARKAALYLRTSHADRTTENQRRELKKAARRAGWSIAAVYEDNGVSGAKGRDGRPGFDQMLKDANRREFDVIMAAMGALGSTRCSRTPIVGSLT